MVSSLAQHGLVEYENSRSQSTRDRISDAKRRVGHDAHPHRDMFSNSALLPISLAISFVCRPQAMLTYILEYTNTKVIG